MTVVELFQTVPSFPQHLIYIIRFTYKKKANQLQVSNARITLKNAFNGFLTPYKSAERLGRQGYGVWENSTLSCPLNWQICLIHERIAFGKSPGSKPTL